MDLTAVDDIISKSSSHKEVKLCTTITGNGYNSEDLMSLPTSITRGNSVINAVEAELIAA